MKEQIIEFIGTDMGEVDPAVLVKICGNEITVGTIDRVKDAICNYKNENESDWDTDGCLNAAREQLEYEGYKVEFISPSARIIF